VIPLSVIPDIDAAGGLGVDVARLLPTQADLSTQTAHLATIGLLRHGTAGGRASVGMVIELPDGTQIIAETSWRLLHNAVRALAVGPVGSEETQD